MAFRKASAVLKAAALIVIACGAADAQEMSLGEFEYMNSCAACHGADGKGDGSIAPLLTAKLPDLTQLAKNNDGLFPVTAAYSMIAGDAGIAAHGSRDMPAWGLRFTDRASSDLDFGAGDIADYTNLRILALVEHLVQLQEE